MSVRPALVAALVAGATVTATSDRAAGNPTVRGGDSASGSGAELIGTAAPDWTLSDWIGSPALSLAGLRGKVVLLRWFTDTSCPYCSLTAPALNQLHRDYAGRGLVVIGVYHHKRSDALDLTAVRGWARDYAFQFPVAVDRDWRTLRSWWLDGHRRAFTSVSFLIDRHGVIRQIHPGGTLAPGTPDYQAMRARIDQLLGG
jgi:peroxiredoxin